MVKNKLFKHVPDAVCDTCSQCWQEECRAFEFAHSKEELAHRSASPVAKCMVKGYAPAVKPCILTAKTKQRKSAYNTLKRWGVKLLLCGGEKPLTKLEYT